MKYITDRLVATVDGRSQCYVSSILTKSAYFSENISRCLLQIDWYVF
jgi:hypothetical protein